MRHNVGAEDFQPLPFVWFMDFLDNRPTTATLNCLVLNIRIYISDTERGLPM